jgi:hypothetical protein
MKDKESIGKRNVLGSTSHVDGRLLQDVLNFITANKLSAAQVKKIFSKEICEWLFARDKGVPISIFDNDKLSALEAVIKYLKEAQGLKLKEIASLLNRNSKTIWTTYNNASKKMPEPANIENINMYLPLKLFQDREVSPLEVVVHYLKDELGFKNHEIAKMLHRDQRTIWATYNRKKS